MIWPVMTAWEGEAAVNLISLLSLVTYLLRFFLRASESCAVRRSSAVMSFNKVISINENDCQAHDQYNA